MLSQWPAEKTETHLHSRGQGGAAHTDLPMHQPASHGTYFILVFNPKTMEPFWLPINLTEQADEVGCAGHRIF